MPDSDSNPSDEAESETPSGADSTAESPEEPAATDEPSPETVPPDEPIWPTTLEKIAALVVLALMVLSMGYLLWIVIRYWGDIQV